jgi:mannose-6-phosphate isomerase-like protein (cupin superfamily)
MIARFSPESEFPTDERCSIVEILTWRQDRECSIARARVAPGMTTQLHSLHLTTERYVILEGTGEVEIGGKIDSVSLLDVVLIAPGVTQRITNTGSGDLVFLCVCTPPFQPAAYVRHE